MFLEKHIFAFPVDWNSILAFTHPCRFSVSIWAVQKQSKRSPSLRVSKGFGSFFSDWEIGLANTQIGQLSILTTSLCTGSDDLLCKADTPGT